MMDFYQLWYQRSQSLRQFNEKIPGLLREQNIPVPYIKHTRRVCGYGTGIDTSSARPNVFYLQILVECELKHL